MCAPEPPPKPDYTQAAQAQGAANLEAAQLQARMSNPSVINPYGTQKVSYILDEPSYQKDLAEYNRKMSAFMQGISLDMTGKPPKEPDRNLYLSPEVTQTLSPEQQALFEKSNLTKSQLADLALTGARTAHGVIGEPVQLGGMPSPGAADLLTGAPALRSTDLTAGAPGLRSADLMAGAPALGSTAFTAGAAPLPQDAAATRNAAYSAIMSRVNEDVAIQRDNLHSDLIAAGIRPGSQAYDERMKLVDRQYTDAQQQAILSANQQAQQDFTQAMQLRQQTVGEAQDIFGATAQARAQAQAEQQAMFTASAAARGQAVQEAKDQLIASASARGQFISEQQAEQQAMDVVRRQAIAEYLMMRQVPLNEIAALMSGTQIANPYAMPAYAQNAQVQPAPTMAGFQGGVDYGTDIFNVGAQQAGNLQTGLFGLGASGIGAFGGKK